MAPGPPGQEGAVREVVAREATTRGYQTSTDPKGNLWIRRETTKAKPKIVVTAHLDEIAMIVSGFSADGAVKVRSLGGLYPWKLGEGPVEFLTNPPVPGVLSFGSIHTESPSATATQAKEHGLTWGMTRVITGLSVEELLDRGVRPGTRCVLASRRRQLYPIADLISGPFLDDRADLLAMLILMEMVNSDDVLFLATAAEEVGGEGALWALHDLHPEVCIALELSPLVPDAPIALSATPALWVSDSYANMQAADIDLVADLGLPVQFQALGRGGSDASCAASHGLVARPFTLGLPMENSHGFEIMHRDAPDRLAQITAALIKRLG